MDLIQLSVRPVIVAGALEFGQLIDACFDSLQSRACILQQNRTSIVMAGETDPIQTVTHAVDDLKNLIYGLTVTIQIELAAEDTLDRLLEFAHGAE